MSVKVDYAYDEEGCEKGAYRYTGSVDSSGSDEEDVALMAKPLLRKPKTPKRLSKQSSGPSSGEQTFVIQDDKLMNPEEIRFTQMSVLKTFSDSSKPSLVTAMQQIFDGDLDIKHIPHIRVAQADESEAFPGSFYTCDNRRLLLFKILRVKEVSVQWIVWSSEFDSKLNQNITFDPDTRVMVKTDGDINAFRKVFVRMLFEKSAEHYESSLLCIPEEFVGYIIGIKGRTKGRLSYIYGTQIKIRVLADEHPASALSDVVEISYRENLNAKNKFVAGKARKEHVKMVRKLQRRKDDLENLSSKSSGYSS